MTSDDSFDHLLHRLSDGYSDAQTEVFRRFTGRLMKLARARLDDRLRRTTDPDDIVQSVWRSFFVRQAEGRFEFKDWGGLWAILTVMTIRKCSRRSVAAQRDKRDVNREVAIHGGSAEGSAFDIPIPDREPTPLEAASLSELIEQLMNGLPDQEREILTLRLQGHTVPEISELVSVTERTVHRKLASIREQTAQLEL